MSENLAQFDSEKQSVNRCEQILLDHIEDIDIYLRIFNEIPDSLEDAAELGSELCKENSVIVISDESSCFGRFASECMIDYDELQSAREGENPPDVVFDIINRDAIGEICDCRHKRMIELPQNNKDKVVILVISDEIKAITLSLSLIDERLV